MSDTGLCRAVRVWLPIRSLGWVNVYPLPGGPGLVDAGMLTGRSVVSLFRGLRETGFDARRLETVLLTHFHVDHSTLAPVLSLVSGAEVYIGEKDLNMLGGGVRRFVEEALERFVENGVPPAEARSILEAHPAMRLEYAYEELERVPVRPVRDGDIISIGGLRLRAVWAPGHTPGSIIYVDEERGLAYVGDVILRGITPHITYHWEGTDPLGDYLRTLSMIAGWRGITACPGHRAPIEDPAGRAREIIAHHEERLREIQSILCRQGLLTGYDVAKRVKWRTRYTTWEEYPAAEKFFAIGEALAHLVHLERRGLVERVQRGSTTLWRPIAGCQPRAQS